jgi:hypothetical protein
MSSKGENREQTQSFEAGGVKKREGRLQHVGTESKFVNQFDCWFICTNERVSETHQKSLVLSWKGDLDTPLRSLSNVWA